MNPQGKKAQVSRVEMNTHFFVAESENSDSSIRAWSSLLRQQDVFNILVTWLVFLVWSRSSSNSSFVAIIRLGSAEDSDEEYPNIGKKTTLLAAFNHLFESLCYDNCGKNNAANLHFKLVCTCCTPQHALHGPSCSRRLARAFLFFGSLPFVFKQQRELIKFEDQR